MRSGYCIACKVGGMVRKLRGFPRPAVAVGLLCRSRAHGARAVTVGGIEPRCACLDPFGLSSLSQRREPLRGHRPRLWKPSTTCHAREREAMQHRRGFELVGRACLRRDTPPRPRLRACARYHGGGATAAPNSPPDCWASDTCARSRHRYSTALVWLAEREVGRGGAVQRNDGIGWPAQLLDDRAQSLTFYGSCRVCVELRSAARITKKCDAKECR